MKLFVAVKLGLKEEKMEKIDDSRLRVSVKEPPRDGRADAAIVRAVADYFNFPNIG